MIRKWIDYIVETLGILRGDTKYLDRGMHPVLRAEANTPEARALYHKPR